MFSSIITFKFDLIFGSFLTFCPNGLFLGSFLEAIASLVVTKALTHSLTHSVESQYLKNHVNTLNSNLVEKAKDIIRGDSLSTSHILTPSLTPSLTN